MFVIKRNDGVYYKKGSEYLKEDDWTADLNLANTFSGIDDCTTTDLAKQTAKEYWQSKPIEEIPKDPGQIVGILPEDCSVAKLTVIDTWTDIREYNKKLK